jgi:GTP cyclohydrolase IA
MCAAYKKIPKVGKTYAKIRRILAVGPPAYPARSAMSYTAIYPGKIVRRCSPSDRWRFAPLICGCYSRMSTQPTPLFRSDDSDGDVPASERIRSRLMRANQRFHANDNISRYIEDGEMDELRAEVATKMQAVLQSLVIDTDSDHNTNETAKRVAKMFLTEVFHGRYVAAPNVTEFPNVARLNELMIVGPITVRSACSHHLCPILGKIWIGIMPNEHSNLIGLSKYARLADWIMSRPQIQEEAVTQLANELQDKVKPDGLAIVMEADHFCMHWRGVKDDNSMMMNSVMRGSFLKDANLRREFLSLLAKKNG